MGAFLRNIVLAGLAFAAAACDEPADTQADRAVAPLSPSPAIAEKRWLGIDDLTPPERWLASREAGADLAPSASEVVTFRDLLEHADRQYSETPRMIANRAVQLEEMLAARGIEENARLIIEGLVELGTDEERRGFGEAGQHYFNIRANGASRGQALRFLRSTEGGSPPRSTEGGGPD